MAVSTIAPLPKSQPDMAKLNGFTGYMVSVTKHLQPRNTVGTVVLPTQKMTKEQLLQLQVHLPLQYGSGFYHFTVSDDGGNGDDTWMVKLGADTPQQEYPMAGSMNGAPPSSFSGPPNVPLDSTAVTQILPGWYYNSNMGLLYTPWRETVPWNQGDPLPKPPAQAAAHAAFTPPASNWGPPAMGGWGGYPVNDSSSKEVEGLKAIIAEQKREREIADMRAEQRRQQDETNKRIDEQAKLTREMFEKLTDVLTRTPKGPSDELRAIQQQNENLQRQIEQDRRDAQAREATAQTREEMRRMKDDTDRMIATITANKSDPMLTMMMQMMQQGNQAAMEAVKAIQSATGAANTSNERQVSALVEQMRGTIISPMQMMEMMRSSRGDGAEMSKMVLETTKEMNALQRNVFEQLLDASSSGGQPPWLQAVQAAMDKIGPIGEAIAARANQPKVIVQRVAVPVQPQPGAMNGAPAQGAQQGVNGAPAQAAVEAVAEPAGTLTNPKKLKKGQKPATIAQIRDMKPEEVAEIAEKFDDKTFFGPDLFPHIKMLRDQIKSGLAPEAAAEMLLRSRPNLMNISPLPPAIELFMAEQIEVLVERIMPDVEEAYGEKVVEVIVAQIEAESKAPPKETVESEVV